MNWMRFSRFSRNLLTIIVIGGFIGGLSAAVLFATPAAALDCTQADVAACAYGLPTEVYNSLLKEMEKYPEPVVEPMPLDETNVDSYTFYKVTPNSPIYDGPNGNPIGSMGDGFSFVNIAGTKAGFGLLKSGGWVSMESLKKTYASSYTGVFFRDPPKYPMVWVVQTSIPAERPGGVLKLTTKALKRYTRLNIFATVKVGDWNWYLVAPGTWIEQRKVAKVDSSILPDGAPDAAARKKGIKWVAVDLYEQVLKAYEGDTLVAATMVSSGIPPNNTNIGTFKVWQRLKSTPMLGAMGRPDAYNLPAVPFVMFFDGEISLHGAYWHDGFGFKRSHGCVNMSISDAHWLFDWSADTAELPVVVWNSYNK